MEEDKRVLLEGQKRDSSTLTFEKNFEDGASFFSILTASFMNPLMSLGMKKSLDYNDMYPIMERDKSLNSYRDLKKYWDSRFPQTTLMRGVINAYAKRFLVIGIYRILSDLLSLVSPIVILYFIDFLSNPQIHFSRGIYLSLILLVSYFIEGSLSYYWYYTDTILANQVRSAFINTIYKKTMRLSTSSRSKETRGNIVNLINVDVDMIRQFILHGHYIISLPFQLIIGFIMLFRMVGWSSLIGLSTLVIFLPLNTYLGFKHFQMNEQVMKSKDNRTGKVTEAINNIRILKFYGWVNVMREKIMELRQIEVGHLRLQSIFLAMIYMFWYFIPEVIVITTFSTIHWFPSIPFTPDTILPAISLFMILKFPLSMLPHLVSGLTQSIQSLKRVEKFLISEELVKPEIDRRTNITFYGQKPNKSLPENVMISFHNSRMKWKSSSVFEEEEDNEKNEAELSLLENEHFQLDIGNLTIEKNTLNIVIGSIASGKSSLLSSIIGEMNVAQGGIAVRNGQKIGFVSQLSWILNASIRDNILFGNEYNHERYQKVLEMCCLLPDLELIPGRDLCEIGEKGVTLSGGQNQRVAIARCIYSNCDIMLFDDPLASLDVDVAENLFKNAIVPLGKHKTVILVTHQLYTLEYADHIVQMDKGKLLKTGKVSDFSIELVSEIYKFQKIEEPTPKVAKEEEEEDDDSDKGSEESDTSSVGKLVKEEERNRGSVKLYYYKKYLKYFGYAYILLAFIPPISGILSNYWLTLWSNQWSDPNHRSLSYYLGIYLVLAISISVGTFITKLISLLNGLNTSQKIHNIALQKVLRSPIQFFDQNLSGRIINRFSRDVSKLDTEIPENLSSTFDMAISLSSTVIFIFISAPLVVLFFLPFIYIIYKVQIYYLANVREIKRLNSNSISPILTQFSETISGQQIIRAYGKKNLFFTQEIEKLDKNVVTEVLYSFVYNWADFRFFAISSALIFFTGISAIIMRNYVQPGMIGLALTYCVTLSGEINYANESFALTETNMNSMERLDHYCTLKEEKEDYTDHGHNIDQWPKHGEVVFDNFTMKYREELNPSLNNIFLRIPASSKVGVCGRTSAGKSSLLYSLFRLSEGTSGRILIDGIDISEIGLMELRSKMSIIPQNPTLFIGTLRYNLDPFSQYSDYEIWEILNKLNLGNLPMGLDCQISEDSSSSFSVGQKQLICLARALLRKSKIIALDESTSAIDNENDQLIQKIIKQEFHSSTVITIAHRLNTIADYDYIVLMSEGRVQKFGKPSEILQEVSRIMNDPDDPKLVDI